MSELVREPNDFFNRSLGGGRRGEWKLLRIRRRPLTVDIDLIVFVKKLAAVKPNYVSRRDEVYPGGPRRTVINAPQGSPIACSD